MALAPAWAPSYRTSTPSQMFAAGLYFLLAPRCQALWTETFDVLMAPIQELIDAHSHCGWANPMDLKVVASTKSDFEAQIEIRADGCGNRLLMMGGFLQCHSVDEHVYHEMMVHPALLTFATLAGRPPHSVFLGGSGDGAGPRELLRWQSLSNVTMVDIDYEVTRFALEWVPGFASGSFEDPRLRLITGDAWIHLKEMPEDQTFDILILDFPDAFDSKELEKLYSKEFYKLCRSHMHDKSVLVTQSGPCAEVTRSGTRAKCWLLEELILPSLTAVFAHVTYSLVHKTLHRAREGRLPPPNGHMESRQEVSV
ncbi:speE [Symbiodinium natans]|uniref:SpeE protein n=1 Tax=Symbiodinium natans TaxID=878477 RepID=A0A812PDA1_9DINO|nr:speE [Symbiodinium natans]